MLVVLDSNILFSALISPHGTPAKIHAEWLDRRFEVATCAEQLEEIRRASRYPKFREILKPHLVGNMLHALQRSSVVENIPCIHEADDPHDSYLLNLSEAAGAQYLVTGDKRAGLLQRKRTGTTRIVKASYFCKSVLKIE